MFKAFFSSAGCSDWKWTTWERVVRAYLGASLLIAIVISQVNVTLLFNSVWGGFLDTLAHATLHTDDELWYNIGLFGFVAACDIILGTVSGYSRRIYALWWREALTNHYITRWESSCIESRHFSQKAHEDTRDFAEIIEGIGLDFVRACMTLIMFIPLLWALNARIPAGPLAMWNGSLILIAVMCAALGLGMSWLLGRSLPDIESQVKDHEAAFREALVRAETDRCQLNRDGGWKARLTAVVLINRQLYLRYGYFDGWSIGYDKIVMLLPYLLCIPYMRSGVITFAVTVQLVHAFGEVQGGFSFILKNWTKVTKLWGVYRRLKALDQDLR